MRFRHVLSTGMLLIALSSAAHAGTVKGAVVAIEGLDSLSATVDSQAKTGAGKILGILMALGGLAMLAAGRPGIGVGGLGAGIAMAFVPNIIGTAFDATAGASLTPSLTLAAHVPGLLAGVAWAGLYPFLLALRLLIDPLVLVSLGLVQGLARAMRG